jgi:hypothetical protein
MFLPNVDDCPQLSTLQATVNCLNSDLCSVSLVVVQNFVGCVITANNVILKCDTEVMPLDMGLPEGRSSGLKLKPVKRKLIQVMCKNSARATKKTPHFTVTKINRLTLFKEIIAVYCENHTKPIETK